MGQVVRFNKTNQQVKCPHNETPSIKWAFGVMTIIPLLNSVRNMEYLKRGERFLLMMWIWMFAYNELAKEDNCLYRHINCTQSCILTEVKRNNHRYKLRICTIRRSHIQFSNYSLHYFEFWNSSSLTRY